MFAPDIAMRAATASVQILGGYGCCWDYPIGRYRHDAKIAEIHDWSSEIQRRVIARNLLDKRK